ncbi:MAG: lectin like domain-containing protein [Gordonibacter sp.]
MDLSMVGKRLAALVLSGVLAVGLCPVVAWGSPSTGGNAVVDGFVEKADDAIARFQATGNMDELEGTDAYDGEPGALARNGAVFPDKYSLVDKGVITPVKFQNPWGTCWSFGAIAAAEASIMSDLRLNVADGALDLSELHTAWFSYMPLPEGSGSQSGEGNHPVDAAGNFTSDPKTVLNEGGMPFTATSVFSSGIGVMSEADVPYRNKEGSKANLSNGYWHYSEEGDWSVDESLRFGQVFELEESSILPTPAGRDGAGEYLYNETGTNAIKQKLAAGRAVEIAFCADSSRPGPTTSPKYINTDTWAHYTYDKNAGITHGVTIVGWDDTYSKNKFLLDHQPPENGAWIVKNSWGSNSKDVASPNCNPSGWGVDGAGYFYLSYYDMSISAPETFEFDTANAGQGAEYYLIDQYDFMPSSGVFSITNEAPLSMANVFEAQENQNIRSLSCETASPDTEVTYQLYLLNDNYANPADGKLLAEKVETYPYGGYHRLSLGEGYPVKAGQHYAVVVTEKTAAGYDMLVDRSLNKAGMEHLRAQGIGYNKYAVGVVNKGESYSFNTQSGTWDDWADGIAEIKAAAAQQGPGSNIFDYDNFALKAYADPLPPTTAIVPDLGNLTEAEALAALGKVGFQGKAGEAAYSDTVEAGRVMGQDVPAGMEKEEGSTITYLLSLGKKPVAPVVPETTTPTGGQSGAKGPLASTGDASSSATGAASLGVLLACGTLAMAGACLRRKQRAK